MPEPETPQPETPQPETPGALAPRRATRSGPGRVLIAVYGLFALAATSRASVQLITQYAEAPLAYVLSAVSGLVYIVATITLALSSRASRRLAWVAIGFELIGVLSVGTASVVDPAAFPRATVWSGYGSGYGYVPLVLPFFGLFWLWRTRYSGNGVSGSEPNPPNTAR